MPIVCQCPAKCQIHLKPEIVMPMPKEPQKVPEIPVEDQLTLKKLESKWLQAQIDEAAARRQIEAFGSAIYSKLGISPQEWELDIKNLTFSARKG